MKFDSFSNSNNRYVAIIIAGAAGVIHFIKYLDHSNKSALK